MLVKLGKEDFQKEDISGHTIELYRPIQILVFYSQLSLLSYLLSMKKRQKTEIRPGSSIITALFSPQVSFLSSTCQCLSKKS